MDYLIEEAKVHTMDWAICIFAISYFLSSSHVSYNPCPFPINLLPLIRFIWLELDPHVVSCWSELRTLAIISAQGCIQERFWMAAAAGCSCWNCKGIQWIMCQKVRQFCYGYFEIFGNLLWDFSVLQMNFRCLSLLGVVVYLCKQEPYISNWCSIDVSKWPWNLKLNCVSWIDDDTCFSFWRLGSNPCDISMQIFLNPLLGDSFFIILNLTLHFNYLWTKMVQILKEAQHWRLHPAEICENCPLFLFWV